MMGADFPFWLIPAVLGMALGAFAIWAEFSKQKKALEVLRLHAEKGTEPSGAVLDMLISAGGGEAKSTPVARNPWSGFAFYLIMAAGFGALTWWFLQGDPQRAWMFVIAFGITGFTMAALAASALITALSPPRAHGR